MKPAAERCSHALFTEGCEACADGEHSSADKAIEHRIGSVIANYSGAPCEVVVSPVTLWGIVRRLNARVENHDGREFIVMHTPGGKVDVVSDEAFAAHDAFEIRQRRAPDRKIVERTGAKYGVYTIDGESQSVIKREEDILDLLLAGAKIMAAARNGNALNEIRAYIELREYIVRRRLGATLLPPGPIDEEKP